MIGEGAVVSVSPGEAVVKISKSSACGHDCASCGACSNPSYEMKVTDPIGVNAGDRVVIESETSKILFISFVLYMLPVFVLIAVSFVCEAYSLGYFGILVYVPLVVLWLVLIKITNKKAKLRNVITKVIA